MNRRRMKTSIGKLAMEFPGKAIINLDIIVANCVVVAESGWLSVRIVHPLELSTA